MFIMWTGMLNERKVREEASYFLRRGTPCIVTFLDCSKAFDMCQFSVLFQKLKKKQVLMLNKGSGTHFALNGSLRLI